MNRGMMPREAGVATRQELEGESYISARLTASEEKESEVYVKVALNLQ